MKINISNNQSYQLNEYLQLCTIPRDGFKQCDITNLDALVCDGEAEEIIIDHALSYVDITKLESTIGHLVKKLSHQGKIIITDYDINEVARKFNEYRISLYEFNICVHGYIPGSPRQSSFSMNTIQEFLKKYRIKIICCRYNENEFVIEGLRE